MKIAIVDLYGTASEFKDPGQIVLGLNDLSVNSFFISLDKKSFSDICPFKVITGNLLSYDFWNEIDADVILFFTRLNPSYTKIIKIIKSTGKILIIKTDSDGTLGFPLFPNYLRTLRINISPIKCVFRNIKWRLPIGFFVKKKLEQIKIADAVIIESPEALSNVAYILYFWKQKELIKKLFFIPNPVDVNITNATLKENKKNIIVSVGRWEDEQCKNTKVMLTVMIEFLSINKNYHYFIIGSGKNVVSPIIEKLPSTIRSRITVVGEIEHLKIYTFLAEAKIFFTPSKLESFGIAAAEALCMGCSLVATPIESFKYLSMGGFSGTISRGFSKKHLLSSLIEDSTKWDRGEYQHKKIAKFWREELNREKIAKKIIKISNYFVNNK